MIPIDVRFALRLMRRSPGFSAAAVLSLALGVGANTAIFSLFYTIVLRPLPVPHPEQLVEFLQSSPGELRSSSYWSWNSYELFRDHNHVFSAITGMSFDNLAAVQIAGGESETLIEENVPANYFRVLGLKPARGRFFGSEDVPASGIGNVVVVSWSYWASRFHGNPAILGKRILVGDEAKTIIGVAPRGYAGPRVGSRTDLWAPQERSSLTMLARLRPGVTLQQAQAEMAVLYRHLVAQQALAKEQERVQEKTIEVEPAGSGLVRVRDEYGRPLVLLLSISGLLLMLMCLNLASMLLARSAGRRREIAVRVGLGAGRGRMVRQMLTESLLLSFAGALVGIVFAYLATGILVRIMASGRAFEHIEIRVEPDLRLLLFTIAMALLTGLLFGLAPAWYAFRFAPASALRESGSGGASWFSRWSGKALVTAQVALSIFLVTAALVFIDHLKRLRNFDLGFRSDHVLLVTLDPARSGYTMDRLATIYRGLLARLEAIPGVHSVSITGCTPLEGCGSGSRYMTAEGYAERPGNRRRMSVTFVSPRYFETLGIPLTAGRDFSFRDVGRSRVTIVSEGMARHYFPGIDPIGKHVTIDRDPQTGGWFGSDQPHEIVGVVGNVKAIELRDAPYPTIYFNMFQENRLGNQFQLRTGVSAASVEGSVRRIVHKVLEGVPVTRVTTLADQVDSNIVPERLITILAELFGLLGAALAGLGIYGLLAYTVARRTNEVGIRMALGATAADVSGLILRDALPMVCGGVLVGATRFLLGRPLAASLVRDLRLNDTAQLVWGGSVMIAVAVCACYVPMRRAVRVDPIVALRHE